MRNCVFSPPSHARTTKWSSEIELFEELPTTVDSESRLEVFWNVPIVDTRSAKPSITSPRQVAMNPKVQKQIFDQNKVRTPSTYVKSVQNIQLVSFDVNRNEIYIFGTGVDQNLVQRSRRNADCTVRFDFREIKFLIERRMTASEIEGHARTRIAPGCAGFGEYPC